jgi:SAM-dependent methyltransferase
MLRGFPTELLGRVLCPRDNGSLMLPKGISSKSVVTASVKCDTCGAEAEIRNGILRLVPLQRPLDQTMVDEQRSRDSWAEQYEDHFEEWENTVELRVVMQHSETLRGKTILDLGCGTGRITRHLIPRARAVVAADFSEESLRLFANSLDSNVDVGLVWSDATQLVVSPGSFDVVISIQVLEHLPTENQRKQFLSLARSALSPDGVFLMSAYYYNVIRQICGRRKEGFHQGGIFYHRFSKAQLRRELAGIFDIKKVRPMQIERRALPGLLRYVPRLAHVFENIFVATLLGRLLFIKAVPVSMPV